MFITPVNFIMQRMVEIQKVNQEIQNILQEAIDETEGHTKEMHEKFQQIEERKI